VCPAFPQRFATGHFLVSTAESALAGIAALVPVGSEETVKAALKQDHHSYFPQIRLEFVDLVSRRIQRGVGAAWKSASVMIEWNAAFKRLMDLMDQPGAAYFSGSRFIRTLQQFNDDLPNYTEYIQQRGKAGKSTTRAVFYKDILMELDEGRPSAGGMHNLR
jgi:hypothetical protein